MKKFIAILSVLLLAAGATAMNINDVDIAWQAGDLVYYAPQSVYDYFQESRGTLPGAPFSGSTPIPSNIIESTRGQRAIVNGQVVTSYLALVDGNWMPISRLYASLDDFKAALQSALATHADALEARAILDRAYIDTVLDIGTSILNVSEAELDFGGTTTELTVEISNPGNARLNWSAVSSLPAKVTMNPDSGQILPGAGAMTMTITVDRSGVSSGTYNPTITLTGDNESAIVELTIIVP